MTFRKEAQAQLKQLRNDGYELTVKLNASNASLHAELVRIERLIEKEQSALVADLLHVEAAIAQESAYNAPVTNTVSASTTSEAPVYITETAKAASRAVSAVKVINLVDRHVVTPYVVPRLRLAAAKVALMFMSALLWLIEFAENIRYDIKFYREMYTSHPELLAQVTKAGKVLIYADQYSKALTMWLIYNILPTREVEGVRVIW